VFILALSAQVRASGPIVTTCRRVSVAVFPLVRPRMMPVKKKGICLMAYGAGSP
jgi:hypothetical protein